MKTNYAFANIYFTYSERRQKIEVFTFELQGQNQIPVENLEILVQFWIWDELQMLWRWSNAVFMVEMEPGLYIRDGAEFEEWNRVTWRAILPTYVEAIDPDTWSFQPEAGFFHFDWQIIDLR